MLLADRNASAHLRAQLSSYLSEVVDDGERLLCTSQFSCRSSVGAARVMIEGQGSYVGACYGLTDGGKPLRILVIPKQVGGSLDQSGDRGHEHVTLDRRGAQVASASFGPRPHPRTDHMIGTALALKVLLGFPAAGPETVSINGDQLHVFDCFAMANATLCSRVGDDASGQGSARMFESCLSHLRQTIAILEPNVVVAQGWSKTGWSPSRSAATILGVPLPQKNSLTVTNSAHGPVAFIAAVHPSRNWFTTTMPSWRELEPVLTDARVAVLGGRSHS